MAFDWEFTTGEDVYLIQLGCYPIIPGSLVILCRDGVNDKILTDDGFGNLSGTGVGIVDYENGWVAFDFYGPSPAIGTEITADYDPVEGGCGADCGKCPTYFVKLSVTPGQISGSDQFTLTDAWERLFSKIERDILPVHDEILREVIDEYYSVNIVYHFDIVPADEASTDESGLHVKLDDTSW
jgi:hypothetical protein